MAGWLAETLPSDDDDDEDFMSTEMTDGSSSGYSGQGDGPQAGAAAAGDEDAGEGTSRQVG